MKTFSIKIDDFKQTMSPYESKGDLARIEHFDTTLGTLKPYFPLVLAETEKDGEINMLYYFRKFIRISGVTYALCRDNINNYMTIAKYNTTSGLWDTYQASTATGAFEDTFFYYDGYFYGLKNDYLWKIKNGDVQMTFHALDFTSVYADPIIHSKDGLAYIPYDNKIALLNSAGTDITPAAITLPATFLITSIAEQGDYINIVGYDSVSGLSTSYLWDRDSSLTTLTAKYELGTDTVKHNATLGNVPFVISYVIPAGIDNSHQEKLIIRYLDGDKYRKMDEYIFYHFRLGGKYISNQKLYFTACFKFTSADSYHHAIFELDENGRLTIAQNLSVYDTADPTAVVACVSLIKIGFFFFTASGVTTVDQQWKSGTAYTTTAYGIAETTKIKSQDINKNIDLLGAVITFKPLPASSSVILKSRIDNETSWTTLATFDTDNAVKGAVTGSGTTTAKHRQFRLESTGGAEITGFQADFEEVNNEVYG